MSIYGTAYSFVVDVDSDTCFEVDVQVVPVWIDYTGPIWDWLPPPRAGVTEDDGYLHPRAVFFCAAWTTKGTTRNGQEYVDYLLMLTGEEWERLPFSEVMNRLIEAFEKHRTTAAGGGPESGEPCSPGLDVGRGV